MGTFGSFEREAFKALRGVEWLYLKIEQAKPEGIKEELNGEQSLRYPDIAYVPIVKNPSFPIVCVLTVDFIVKEG